MSGLQTSVVAEVRDLATFTLLTLQLIQPQLNVVLVLLLLEISLLTRLPDHDALVILFSDKVLVLNVLTCDESA